MASSHLGQPDSNAQRPFTDPVHHLPLVDQAVDVATVLLPFGKLRYDNLKAAVAQIIGFTRAREETERCKAFRSHSRWRRRHAVRRR
jgi:hypothetical protein